MDAVEYIAKLADGGMRDALSFLDKCLAYSPELTLQNVIEVLGTAEYDDMIKLTDHIIESQTKEVIALIEDLYGHGKDMKQFIKTYLQFLLDVQKVAIGCDWKYINIPRLDTYERWLNDMGEYEFGVCMELLELMMRINTEVKNSSAVKYDIEAYLVTFIGRNNK